MSLHHYIQCNGPGCDKKLPVIVECRGRKGFQYRTSGDWFRDKSQCPGVDDWCSTACHIAWWNARFPGKKQLKMEGK